MRSTHRKKPSSEKGFALVTALMACAILFALAMLIIQLSTGDLRVSAKSVGDKKASIAAEAGIQQVLNSSVHPRDLPRAENVAVDADNAPGSDYSYATPTPPSRQSGRAAFAPLTGYSIGGNKSWGQARLETRITGRNTRYGASVQVDLGIGYFDIITTQYD
jgi:Tfp pilus assembly protein PilX